MSWKFEEEEEVIGGIRNPSDFQKRLLAISHRENPPSEEETPYVVHNGGFDLGVDVSIVSDPTDPACRIRTESGAGGFVSESEFREACNNFSSSTVLSSSTRYSENRRYLFECTGCRHSRTIDTGPFELGRGAACARCGCGVEVSQI